MTKSPALLGRLALAAALAALAAPPAAADRVATIDGRTIEGAVESIDAQRVVVNADGKAQSIAREDVLSVRLNDGQPAGAAALMEEAGRHVLVARDGSRVEIADATVAEGTLRARFPAFGKMMAVPLDRVAYLLRPAEGERPSDLERQFEALRLNDEAKDHVVIAGSDGRAFPLAGIVRSLDPKVLTFRYDDTDALLEAATVRVVRFAAPRRDVPKPGGHLVCLDGSRVAFTALELSDGKVRLPSAPAFGETIQIDASRVADIRFLSDRLAYLSDLEPAAATSTGYFDTAMPWRKDRACDGGPIRLGGVTYEKGLGLHSRTELAYDLDGRYRQFAAVAGIDEGVRFGTADLTVTGDGRTLLGKTRLDRADPPKSLRLDVAGMKRLVILVDFVEGTFGVAGRVDLADAKLIK